MHLVALGIRKRLSHEPRQPLAQNVVEPLNMTRLPRAFARRTVLGRRQHLGIRLPEVRIQHALLVRRRNATPQQTARSLTTPADGIRDDLARSAALGQPDPAFVFALMHERPEFV